MSGSDRTAAPITAICKSPFLEAALRTRETLSLSSLRRFGFTLAPMFILLGAFLSWHHRTAGRLMMWLGFLLLASSIIRPALLRFIYRPWMLMARILGTITSSILLTIVFYLIVTPLGLLQRLFGKATLETGFVSDRPTYWEARASAARREEYERQF